MGSKYLMLSSSMGSSNCPQCLQRDEGDDEKWSKPVRDLHVLHKVPAGDGPYVKAKQTQLVDKNPDRAIALFWAAINAGDRVDSALKDMAIAMKQQNRAEEAIEAIRSLRYRCSDKAQESLDNVLLDLYKRCGRVDEQIALLRHKLNLIQEGLAFNGKPTKTARSRGKKFQQSLKQEAIRLLGNLGWAYMQQSNYLAAEVVYRKALCMEPDNNKACNLGVCLIKQGRFQEAASILENVRAIGVGEDEQTDNKKREFLVKSYERAQGLLDALKEAKVTGVKGDGVGSPTLNPCIDPILDQHGDGLVRHYLPDKPSLGQEMVLPSCLSKRNNTFSELLEQSSFLLDDMNEFIGATVDSATVRSKITEVVTSSQNTGSIALIGFPQHEDVICSNQSPHLLPSSSGPSSRMVEEANLFMHAAIDSQDKNVFARQFPPTSEIVNQRRLRVFQEMTILGTANG